MKIEVAKGAGFCSGVKRAISLALSSVEKDQAVFSLGPLIHNNQVIEDLKKRGIALVSSIDEVEKGIIIFRSHGASPEDYIKAREKGLLIADGTCPIVAKVQRIAKSLNDEGYPVVILGDKNHPEIKGIVGFAKDAIVISKPIEAISIKEKRIGLIAQTTQSLDDFKSLINILLDSASCIKVYNTICKAVLRLQRSSISLAKKSDLFIVIGGKNSANTKRLFLLTKNINPNTYHIEKFEEIDKSLFLDKKKIGITGGTSTPPEVISEVVEKIKGVKYG
ncbi:MAG: 4-hydroxy-3-methylbut-2-enyl diphosphate reductase [bacterium]